MSATPSPSGGAPVRPKGPKPPAATNLSRFGPQILLVGLGVGLSYAYFATKAPQKPGTPAVNPLRTPGVKNIENAYSNAGATPTHTPAYGGSKIGDRESIGLRDGGGTGRKDGMNDDGIGEEQRPTQPTAVGKAWNEMKYGSPTGK